MKIAYLNPDNHIKGYLLSQAVVAGGGKPST
jgi:hypothetical protein